MRVRGSDATPLDGVDTILADLDGVVYRGPGAIPHAVESLNAAAGRGIRLGYLTNNAARTDASVAAHLAELGLPARPEDVVTSPQAAVRLLAARLAPGARVLVTGGEGLRSEVEKAGFQPVSSADDRPAAVVQGFSPDLGWRDLAEASYALADASVYWVATNMDWSIPQARGIAPGNGTLVSAVHSAVGRLPDAVAGKPERPIFDAALERFGARRALFLGDRIDTDIVGANRAGLASALVLTGIDGVKQLLAAKAEGRPTYILEDLRGLAEPYPRVETKRGATRVGGASVAIDGTRVEIKRRGERVDTIRALCHAVWAAGTPVYALQLPDDALDL